jgi:hypothetical protein
MPTTPRALCHPSHCRRRLRWSRIRSRRLKAGAKSSISRHSSQSNGVRPRDFACGWTTRSTSSALIRACMAPCYTGATIRSRLVLHQGGDREMTDARNPSPPAGPSAVPRSRHFTGQALLHRETASLARLRSASSVACLSGLTASTHNTICVSSPRSWRSIPVRRSCSLRPYRASVICSNPTSRKQHGQTLEVVDAAVIPGVEVVIEHVAVGCRLVAMLAVDL